MKLGGTRPPGDNPLLLSISGTGSFIYVWSCRLGWVKNATGDPRVMQNEYDGTRFDHQSVLIKDHFMETAKMVKILIPFLLFYTTGNF